jgi:hypothetical protein
MRHAGSVQHIDLDYYRSARVVIVHAEIALRGRGLFLFTTGAIALG